jgi:hypothetical protein
MELSLGIILDELAIYNPILRKKTKNQKISRFRYYDSSSVKPDNACLYVAGAGISGFDAARPCPKHLIVVGDALHKSCLKKADTVIQVPGGSSVHDILQAGFDMFESFEAWNQDMLLAIINRSPISAFLEVCAAKLANPVALFDNSVNLIAKAGTFINSPKGTIWEKIGDFGIIASDFFTIQEHRMLAEIHSKKSNAPFVYSPAADKGHAYVSSYVWINDKLYGSIGAVDINAPFTDGQLDITLHINGILKLYFENNEEYRRIAENKLKYLDSLLEGIPISEEIVGYYLNKAKWKINDDFYFLSFECPVPFASPVESASYIKLLNRFFPKALISVYQNRLIAVIRRADYPVDGGRDLKQLEKILHENEMWCGISTPFNDFMRLRYYYAQSVFAAEYCKAKVAPPHRFLRRLFCAAPAAVPWRAGRFTRVLPPENSFSMEQWQRKPSGLGSFAVSLSVTRQEHSPGRGQPARSPEYPYIPAGQIVRNTGHRSKNSQR